MVNGLVTGIKSRCGQAVEAVTGLGAEIRDKFKTLLGIASPSRVFMGFGANIGEGAQLGMTGKLASVKGAAAQLAGVTAASAMLATGGAAHADPRRTTGAAQGTGTTIHFAPTIHVGAGGGDVRGQLNEGMQLSMRELEQMLRRLQADQQRRAF